MTLLCLDLNRGIALELGEVLAKAEMPRRRTGLALRSMPAL